MMRWGVLSLLALGPLIAFVDRTNISSALAVAPFKDHFNLSNLDRGWVNSAFFWSYAIFQVPMGWLVDRYGVKRPYAICFAVWCLASAAVGLMPALGGLIVMRLMLGAGDGVVSRVGGDRVDALAVGFDPDAIDRRRRRSGGRARDLSLDS